MGKHINHYKVGDSKLMNCGMSATIIEKRNYRDIDVRFENGCIIEKTETKMFHSGSIKYTNYKPIRKIRTTNRLGEQRLMNCRMMAKIIEYRQCDEIDVEFEDGLIVKNVTYKNFLLGSIHNKNCKKSTNKADERIGLQKKNNNGSIMKIVEYIDYDNMSVEFQDEYKTVIKTKYGHFKKGDITNPYFKSKFNVGCIGLTSAMDSDGKYKKSYKYWSNMLRRCYFDNIKCYKDVKVCDEWLCYENFEKWYSDNYIEKEGISLCLDKDILSYKKGIVKIYSPYNCSFVPVEINASFKPNITCITYNEKHNNYKSKIGGSLIGTYKTYEEARNAYIKSKNEKYSELANKYKEVLTEEIFEFLYNYKGE